MATKAPTALIHHPYRPPEGFDSPQPGIFKASSVFFPHVAAMRSREWKDKTSYTYGLHGTPTTFLLEERIASLEGGHHCVLLPSGLAALACVNLALLKAGVIVRPVGNYGLATWLRISVGLPEENDRFLTALSATLGKSIRP